MKPIEKGNVLAGFVMFTIVSLCGILIYQNSEIKDLKKEIELQTFNAKFYKNESELWFNNTNTCIDIVNILKDEIQMIKLEKPKVVQLACPDPAGSYTDLMHAENKKQVVYNIDVSNPNRISGMFGFSYQEPNLNQKNLYPDAGFMYQRDFDKATVGVYGTMNKAFGITLGVNY